jgi:hypothetical protein
MAKRILEEIQRRVREGKYDLTFHAVEEMAEDYLDIFDVEAALMSGSLQKTESDDPRGTRYTICRHRRRSENHCRTRWPLDRYRYFPDRYDLRSDERLKVINYVRV